YRGYLCDRRLLHTVSWFTLLRTNTLQFIWVHSDLLNMSFCSFLGGEIYKDHFKPGIYVCSQCGHQLFSSRSKYEHSSPWPAFTETIREDSVTKIMETPSAFKVLCGNTSLKFVPKDKVDRQ
ncbi:hypothetical protein MATL_G00008240, partial [Megalops atlanticus]